MRRALFPLLIAAKLSTCALTAWAAQSDEVVRLLPNPLALSPAGEPLTGGARRREARTDPLA